MSAPKFVGRIHFDSEDVGVDAHPWKWELYERWANSKGEERQTLVVHGRAKYERHAVAALRRRVRAIRKEIAYGSREVEL